MSETETEPQKRVEKRIELPNYLKLQSVDEQGLKMLEDMEKEPKVDYYCEQNNDTGYTVTLNDGSITRISQTPTINGVQFLLVPGINKIPLSLANFLDECKKATATVHSTYQKF